MDDILESVQWIQFPEVMTAYPDGCAAEGAYASARWPGAMEKLRTVAWHGNPPYTHLASGAKYTLTLCAPAKGVPTKMGY